MGKLQVLSDNYIRTTDLRFVTSDLVPSSIVSAAGKILDASTRTVVETIVLTAKDASAGEYHGFFSPASVPDTTPLAVQVIITVLDADSNQRTIIEEETITPVRA